MQKRADLPVARIRALTLLTALAAGACGEGSLPVLDTSELPVPRLVQTVEGFEGPESVYFDASQDVWFVSSFTGSSGERDGNGTVSRVDGTSGEVTELAWARPSDEHPFHSGRGMTLQGDTLWVADIDGVHGFHRVSGEQLAFVDLSALEPGFLNDVAASPDGTVWVTDTGGARIIQVRPEAGVAVDISERIGPPNGILWDDAADAFWVAPWETPDTLYLWDPATGDIRPGAMSGGATRVDGLASWGSSRILSGVQADSAIHVLDRDSRSGARWIELPGRPADIGFDPGRQRIAVPYVALNQVQIWSLGG